MGDIKCEELDEATKCEYEYESDVRVKKCFVCCDLAEDGDGCNKSGFVKPSILFIGSMIASTLAVLEKVY